MEVTVELHACHYSHRELALGTSFNVLRRFASRVWIQCGCRRWEKRERKGVSMWWRTLTLHSTRQLLGGAGDYLRCRLCVTGSTDMVVCLLRVVGPPAVVAHVRHGWVSACIHSSLPRPNSPQWCPSPPPPQPLPASTQPVFSMAMHRVVACFTQIETREKRVSPCNQQCAFHSHVCILSQDELSQRVKLMGGKVCGDFTRHVSRMSYSVSSLQCY